MIIDKQLMFSDGQDLTGQVVGTALSTNSINTSVARDIAKGEPLYVVIVCDVGVTTATHVEFKLISATNSALTTAVKTLATTGNIASTALTAGRTPIVLPLPPMMAGMDQQHIGVSYTVVGATVGVGKFTAFLGIGPHTNF